MLLVYKGEQKQLVTCNVVFEWQSGYKTVGRGFIELSMVSDLLF